MKVTLDIFAATGLLFCLPALVGIARWPWEGYPQRAAAAVTVLGSMVTIALAWWFDAIRVAEVNKGMVAALFCLPVLVAAVAFRAVNWFGPIRKDLKEAQYRSLLSKVWIANSVAIVAMFIAMYLVATRL